MNCHCSAGNRFQSIDRDYVSHIQTRRGLALIRLSATISFSQQTRKADVVSAHTTITYVNSSADGAAGKRKQVGCDYFHVFPCRIRNTKRVIRRGLARDTAGNSVQRPTRNTHIAGPSITEATEASISHHARAGRCRSVGARQVGPLLMTADIYQN